MNDTYKLTRIEGEYAYLENESSGEELFIAMALLPLGADIGSRFEHNGYELVIIN